MVIKHRALGGALLALALAAGLSTHAFAQASAIDFGDDSSEWAKDGECDDPRFAGTGMAAELEDTDTLKDATDCKAAFDAGNIALVETPPEEAPVAETLAPATTTTATASDVDFGDDTSSWAHDGECDDPRFAGTGMAVELEDADVLKDATDCRTAFEAGTISIAETGDIPADPGTVTAAVDFGDDSSEWAKDEECDDPRFAGSAMAGSLDDINIGKDATDCEAAFNAGTVALAETQPGGTDAPSSNATLTAIANRIDFGDDSGNYPNDGECDDPDFAGSAMASDPLDGDRLKDATDCRAAFVAGTVSLKGSANQATAAFDYGSDFSQWANDGQCDDWRFTGGGMAKKLTPEDVLGDASDCQALEQSGEISVKRVYQPDYAANAPYDSSGVDFGDNSSDYANDEVCDDPRFEGPGVASTLLDSDRMADSEDCKAAYEAGTIDLREGQA